MNPFKKKILEELKQMAGEISFTENDTLNEQEITHLPAPVKRWLISSGAVGREKVKSVQLEQKFQMKLKPEQKKWYHAHARQLFLTESPSFIWTVGLKMMPLISVLGRDKFIDGKGEMQMKLNGLIGLGKETGPKMDEGTLQRYLGETVWFPSAAVSPYIRWEEIDDSSAKATMNYKGTTGSGTFFFNEDGHFIRFVALRYLGNSPDARRYEWVITANKQEQHNGITIPVDLDATWMLDSGPWTWCNIKITEINNNIEPQKMKFV